MLKDAGWQIRLCEDAALLQVHFSFAEEIPETGYEAHLSNGFCCDKSYEMTVKNIETNEIYQKRSVPLSIEIPDMITFLDLNADGYLDMQMFFLTANSRFQFSLRSHSNRFAIDFGQ